MTTTTMYAQQMIVEGMALFLAAFYAMADAILRCENCGKPLIHGWICGACGWDNINHKEDGK